MAAKPFVAVDFCKKIIGRCSTLAEKKDYLLVNGQQCIPPSNKLLDINLNTLERVQHKLLDKPIHSPNVGPKIQELIHILAKTAKFLSQRIMTRS
ncbi:unnamed protein product [Sphagnum troendelagicum]|uniref:Ribosomal protein S13 n=1 Tax=Sphagnum troendelagicum TaxID=128251 RepID=A0ABP0V247_9BRYO